MLAAGGLNPSDFASNPLIVGTPPAALYERDGRRRGRYRQSALGLYVDDRDGLGGAAGQRFGRGDQRHVARSHREPRISTSAADSLAGKTLTINGTHTINFDTTATGVTTTGSNTTIGLQERHHCDGVTTS